MPRARSASHICRVWSALEARHPQPVEHPGVGGGALDEEALRAEQVAVLRHQLRPGLAGDLLAVEGAELHQPGAGREPRDLLRRRRRRRGRRGSRRRRQPRPSRPRAVLAAGLVAAGGLRRGRPWRGRPTRFAGRLRGRGLRRRRIGARRHRCRASPSTSRRGLARRREIAGETPRAAASAARSSSPSTCAAIAAGAFSTSSPCGRILGRQRLGLRRRPGGVARHRRRPAGQHRVDLEPLVRRLEAARILRLDPRRALARLDHRHLAGVAGAEAAGPEGHGRNQGDEDGGAGEAADRRRGSDGRRRDRNRRVVVAVEIAHGVLACFDTLYPVGAAAPTPMFADALIASRHKGRRQDSKTGRKHNRDRESPAKPEVAGRGGP